MRILILEEYALGYYSCGHLYSKFTPLGHLLTDLTNIGKDLLIEWLEKPDKDLFSSYLFGLRKEQNRVSIIFPEDLEVPIKYPLVIDVLRFVQIINEFHKSMKIYKSVVVMKENDNYFVKGFSSYPLGFIEIRMIKGDPYVTHNFSRWHPLGGIGLLLVSEMRNEIIEWLISSQENFFQKEDFTLQRHNEFITITVAYKDSSFVTTTTFEEKYLLKINEYYENIIKQDIEDFLLIQTEEGYSFMTNPFEEIKVVM